MLMSLLRVSFWWDIKSYGEENKWDEEQKIEEMQTKRGNKKQRQGGRNFGACVPHPWKLSSRQPVVKRCCGQLLRRRAAVKLNSQAPSSHVEKSQSLPQNRGQRGLMVAAYCAVVIGRESVPFGDWMYAYLVFGLSEECDYLWPRRQNS